jgi:hypothetical protein
MKKILLGMMAIATLSFGSATIFSGTTQAISIDSIPSGAKVYVDGQLRGTTPTSVMMKKSLSSHTIRVQKDGYAVSNVVMEKTIDPVSILSLFWDFSTTDALTGSIMEYSPNHYMIELKKK